MVNPAAGGGPVLVVSAHAGDFVWRAGGAMALAASRGAQVTVVCLSFGERGESARAWRAGKQLDEIKAIRRDEAASAADVLGAKIEFLDAGDYPLRESAELVDEIVHCYRREPELVPLLLLGEVVALLGRGEAALRRQAELVGVDEPGRVLDPPLELVLALQLAALGGDQPEQCDFKPQVLLDITEVFGVKRRAMECLVAQQHMWDYYTDLARRRGVQLRRNAGPNLGLAHDTMAEAYMRVYPQVTGTLR